MIGHWVRVTPKRGTGRGLRKAFLAVCCVVAVSAPATAASVESGVAAYERGDYFRAVQQWRPLAERGDPKAQTALGLAYYHGQGVPQDYGEAVVWYRRASEQGYAYAQGLLGYLYFQGQGVHQDYMDAYFWLNLAVAGLPPGRERELAITRRGYVQTQLSPNELHTVQERAAQWRPAPAVPEDVQ
ncbi:tetratricopeptide repeat protein [Microbaculum marinisediminis]|uniref:Sel1 repeat family protein n=1 Tax=Microbaculum marinisediminis TaxID=2931392 RepID=A0AAW5R5P0_9HYPH|nr:tetratricopeptide repeat protein [Microbaculum sp. A6E488]MCT8974707.1 sel1 repeat family protein [Microbaculum sp. A6E488]